MLPNSIGSISMRIAPADCQSQKFADLGPSLEVQASLLQKKCRVDILEVQN